MFDVILLLIVLILGIKLLKDAAGCFMRFFGLVLILTFVIVLIRMIGKF